MEKCVGEAVGGRDPDLPSTDNESRSPWEVTGQSQKNKTLRKRMELEGKAWPPSPTTYAAGMASESDDDDVPNVPASSGGDTGSGLNLHALVVPPMPPTPSSDGSSDDDDGDERVNHDYITPPKRATTMPQWSSMKSMKMNEDKVKKEPNLSKDDAAASWLATAVAVVWMVMLLVMVMVMVMVLVLVVVVVVVVVVLFVFLVNLSLQNLQISGPVKSKHSICSHSGYFSGCSWTYGDREF